jgi:alpha-ketoglutarate-dependent 2,4-dichlorophenoxyacetate dioxygenase
MAFDIKPIDPFGRPFFAGVVSGIDLTRLLSAEEVAAIHGGMDRFGVLVFHDQHLTDDQQLAFSRQLGPLETATGDIAAPQDRRLDMELGDISNLDKHSEVLPREDRRRLFGLGNQLWHSDSSFKEVPAKYSLLSARTIPDADGNTEFADMRAAYDALDDKTRREVQDLICNHSQIFSRGVLGFTDFTDAERMKWVPVRQRLVRKHPSSGRLSLYLSVALSLRPCRRHRGLASARSARLPARSHRARHATQVRLCPCLEAPRPGDVGQPRHHAPRAALRSHPGA